MIIEVRIDLSNIPKYGLSYFSGGVQQFVLMYEEEFEILDKHG